MINYQLLKEKLLDLCQKIYPLRIIEDSISLGKTTDDILEFAKSNRLAHYLALECNFWPELITEHNDYQKKIKKALQIVKGVLGKEPLIVIKTFSSYPHFTSDLDLIVKDSKTAQRLRKVMSKKKIELPIEIDISSKISWTDEEEISNQFVWNNTQKYSFDKIDFLVPNPQLDVLIRIAHIPFELAEIRLGELLHVYKQSFQIEWKILEAEAKSMGWPKTFKKMTEMLELLHQTLFGKPFLEKSGRQISSMSNLKFPFQIPYFYPDISSENQIFHSVSQTSSFSLATRLDVANQYCTNFCTTLFKSSGLGHFCIYPAALS